MTAALRVESLKGGYGKLQVFRDVALTLGQGETVGVLGVNGAGKTTLLRTVAGLLPSFSGRIMLDDLDITHWPTFRRARAGLALVPEGRLILGTLTVRDNLELTRAAGTERSAGQFDARLSQVFDLFPKLAERLDQLGGSLSGGEQQMLSIARALLMNPLVLMLDEPTQGLAPIVVRLLAETLGQLKGRFAIVLVEQNKAFLESLVDRIFMMRAGRLEAV
jgi:ABC-type branched-subunit amino acid transport system ATPase component